MEHRLSTEELRDLLERAASGEDLPDLMHEAIDLARADADAIYEAECDGAEAERMDDRDDKYVYGCGEYDSVDSRGEKLRPAVNDAGEPWWM